MISLPQALELAHALQRNGWKPADVKWLSVGDRLTTILHVARGTGDIHIAKHVVNLAVDPSVPIGFKGIEHHEKGAADFEWNPAKVRLHLSENQEGANSIEGNKLRMELVEEVPFNANLLDYLLKNPHLIPEEWKGKYVYFWGTIYRDSLGGPCVLYLYLGGSNWCWTCRWLGSRWDSFSPAACLVK